MSRAHARPRHARSIPLAQRRNRRTRLTTAHQIVTLLGIGLVAVSLTMIQLPATSAGFTKAIEPVPGYEPQRTCSPSAKPGARKLISYLTRTYPGTGNSGISRDCGQGGTSEHKEGRAVDWRVNYYNATQRQQADRFLSKLFAPDEYGNKFALARRMGVMYAIWNKKIFSVYNPGWRAYTGPSPHRDHVHISLTYAGGMGQTSWYTGKVSNPTPNTQTPPAIEPAPGQPSVPGQPNPPILNQRRIPHAKVSVPVTGYQVRTPFSLKAGTRYQLVATGVYRYGTDSAEVADALCQWNPWTTSSWAKSTTVPGLTVNGASVLRPHSGWGCNTTDHLYVASYTPRRTGPLTLRVADRWGRDNIGRLTVHVIPTNVSPTRVRTSLRSASLIPVPRPVTSLPTDGTTLIREDLVLPADNVTGVSTAGVMKAGVQYKVEVTGTITDGHGQADAECSVRSESTTWKREVSVDPFAQKVKHLDVYLNGGDLALWPVTDSGNGCASDHSYRTTVTPRVTGRAMLALFDPFPRDNTGQFQVRISRLGWPGKPVAGPVRTDGVALASEQVVVPAGARNPVLTTGVLQAGVRYRITATGRYSYGAGQADAECSTAPSLDPGSQQVWRRWATEHRRDGSRLFGDDLFDLYLDGRDLNLKPTGESVGENWWDDCDTTGSYTGTFTALRTSRMQLALWGSEPRDATGELTVTITPIRRWWE